MRPCHEASAQEASRIHGELQQRENNVFQINIDTAYLPYIDGSAKVKAPRILVRRCMRRLANANRTLTPPPSTHTPKKVSYYKLRVACLVYFQ